MRLSRNSCAEPYYSLAFFDVIKRGLVELKLVPVNGVDESDLQNGPLQLEIAELTLPGRPREYAAALKKVGVDEGMRTRILALVVSVNQNGVPKDSAGSLRDLISRLGGVAESVPLVTWRPDKQTTDILGWASREMKLAVNGSRMFEAPGWLLVDRERFQKLSARIDRLLSRSQEQNSEEERAVALANQVVNNPCSVPSLQADPAIPGTVFYRSKDDYGRSSVTTEVFVLKANWEFVWNAKFPIENGQSGFLSVELFRSEDRVGKFPEQLVLEDFPSPDSPARLIAQYLGHGKSSDCESLFTNPSPSGAFYLKIGANVPYRIAFRQRTP
jgi:hypothetical protein